MKERVTAFLTLGCIFSLFFYYKVYSTNDESVLSINNIDDTKEIVEKLIIDIENIETDLSGSSDNQKSSQNYDDCLSTQNETDVLAFSDAFKYYRNCKGKASTFVWNEIKYTTILESEKSKVPTLITNNESSITNNKVDKHHYDLQREMLGLSIDTK